jgi:CelD/BcsL family acetyltransferase involved in cellulose biosynthesis
VNRTLRLVLLQEIPEDADLRQQWNVLVQRVDQPQVFYTYEWSLAVQRAYRATLPPLLFLAYDERESLCGVVSLAAGGAGRRAFFLCATTGDYCDFIAPPEHKPAFVAAVLADLKKQGIDDITLTNLPADSNTVAAIRNASVQNGYFCFARTAYQCAQVSLAQLERRPGEKPNLPRKKMLRRFLNAMGREAPVRLDHARSWDAVAPILPHFVQAHVARFLATGRISNLARPERRMFLEELAKLLSASGWLTLTRMMSGESAYAWNYGFEFHGTWFWYQPTFETVLEKYSPGFCLLAKLTEEAADNPGLRTIDLGLGAEEYKERFANQSRETLYVTLRSSRLRHAREILRYRAAAMLKISPRLEACARAVTVRWRQLRERAARDGIAPTLQRLVKRASAAFWSEAEVCFFEWRGPVLPDSSATLKALDLNLLASAASQYVDDPSTLAYLLRSASRLRDGNAEGFGMLDANGAVLHFAWATAFDKFFLSELNVRVDAPSPGCVMIFDCWTPVSARGHGYYGQTVSLIAKRMRDRGNSPWIFSAASNLASIRGLEKAGFQRRYSLVRQQALGLQRIKGKTPKLDGAPVAEVSARV